MTRQTFTWFPDVDSQQDARPDVTVTKFGDGYEVRQAVGINAQLMKWSLTFTRTREEAKAILAFLRAHNAVTAFNWTNPLNEEGVYVCRAWKTRQSRGYMEVTCDFEQVFEF